MLGWEFPPHISGGLGTACYGLAEGLVNQDISLDFVVPKMYGDEAQSKMKLIDLSKEIYKKGDFSKNKLHSKEFKFNGGYKGDVPLEIQRYALLAPQIAQQSDFELIHAHDWLTYLTGIELKKITGKPLVIHVHATEFDRTGENVNQYVYDIEKKGMEEADAIITVSNLTKNIVVNRYGINAQKVFPIHNAVKQTGFTSSEENFKPFEDKVVTFLGRITFQKGPEYFVKAAQKVLEQNPNVQFVMAGSGDMMQGMIHLMAELRIGSNFHFTGFLRGDDVNKILAMSDAYVMPSVSEPFGISPLEAMKADVPVIISKQSGVSEILKHSIKVDFWDIEALADVICGVLSYPKLQQNLRKEGREEVKSMTWYNVGEKVKKLYQKILSETK